MSRSYNDKVLNAKYDDLMNDVNFLARRKSRLPEGAEQ